MPRARGGDPFYKTFKRQPTKQEMEDMAIAMVTGDPSAPQVEGWIPDSAEVEAAMQQNKGTIEAIKRDLETLDSVKNAVKNMTGTEMNLTSVFEPETYKAYKQTMAWAQSVGGATARQARAGAILVAPMLQTMAQRISRLTGKKTTALDILNQGMEFRISPLGKGGLTQQGEIAAWKLKRDSRKWSKTVDEYDSADKEEWKKNRDGDLLNFMDVPLVLQILGVDYDKINAYGSFFWHSLNPRKHLGMDLEMLRQLPAKMADPIMIVKGNKKDSYVFVLDMKNANDATVVVPVHVGKKDDNYGIIDVMESAYGKDGDNGIPSFNWLKKDIESGNVLYMNTQKSALLHGPYRSYFPAADLLKNAFDTFIVSPEFEKVKTEKDLEKAQMENPGMYQLAGEKAETASQAKLQEAKAMEAEGAHMKDIYKETGWLKGYDGKWRFEIPDNLDDIDFNVFAEGNPDSNFRYLKAIYKNQQLYEAYPWLSLISVRLEDLDGNVEGAVARNSMGRHSIVIDRNISDEDKKTTLVHEIQHLIQEVEGFASGGTPETVYEKIRERVQDLSREIGQHEYGEWYAQDLLDQQEMIFAENKNPEAKEELDKEIETLEQQISPEDSMPRARGGDPSALVAKNFLALYAPRTRG